MKEEVVPDCKTRTNEEMIPKMDFSVWSAIVLCWMFGITFLVLALWGYPFIPYPVVVQGFLVFALFKTKIRKAKILGIAGFALTLVAAGISLVRVIL